MFQKVGRSSGHSPTFAVLVNFQTIPSSLVASSEDHFSTVHPPAGGMAHDREGTLLGGLSVSFHFLIMDKNHCLDRASPLGYLIFIISPGIVIHTKLRLFYNHRRN